MTIPRRLPVCFAVTAAFGLWSLHVAAQVVPKAGADSKPSARPIPR